MLLLKFIHILEHNEKSPLQRLTDQGYIFQSLKVPVQMMHGAVLYCPNIHTYWDGLRKCVVLLA